MRRTALWTLGGTVLIIAVVWVIGAMLPVAHVASGSAAFAEPPESLYAVISDTANYSAWLDDETPVAVVDAQPPRRVVTRVVADDLPYGGTWTFDIAPAGAGSRVTITEHGEVYNPLFRFMSRFVFGHTATIDKFLAALAARSPSAP